MTSGGKEPVQVDLAFDSNNLGASALMALVLAPLIPGYISQVLLVIAVVASMVIHLGFWYARHKLSRPVMLDPKAFRLAKAFTSEEVYVSMFTSQSTIAVLMGITVWLGATGLLWVLDSFFVSLITLHCLSTTFISAYTLYVVEGEVDDPID